MARNKYPEETVEKILDAAMRLFIEKGYENTSIQDIIDNLGGLTKGAIYHHFKSKEDIMLAVLERQHNEYDAKLYRILNDRDNMTGLARLRALFWIALSSPRQENFFRSSPSLLNNPKMLILQMKGTMEEAAPQHIAPLIQQGIEDGSIRTDYPLQLAEVILLLSNLWVTPLVFAASPQDMEKRLKLFGQLLEPFGANFIDEDFTRRIMDLTEMYGNHPDPE
ncbi:TetR/AcrR family transcriptional regulator [Ruminococcaceae bacterium OttesenSCG-928-L11]|nr:TetR/AcrR family transcriptional regulator [Ruminococcaceae bacterium OttesenSCG-928-L11]